MSLIFRDTEIEQLQMEVDLLETLTQDISQLSNEVDQAQLDIIQNTNSINLLNNEQITQNTAISNIQTDITNINNEQITQNTAISNIQTDISNINNEQITQNNDILSLQNSIANLDLNALIDVTLSNIQPQDVLQYNSLTSQWVNSPAPNTGIQDVVDNQNYVRQLNNWELLSNTTEFVALSTLAGNTSNTLSTVLSEQITQNN